MMNGKTETGKDTSRKMLNVAIAASIAVYLVGVALMFLGRVLFVTKTVSTWEMIYGPAITIASGWMIFGVVHILTPRKKEKTQPTSDGDVANRAAPKK